MGIFRRRGGQGQPSFFPAPPRSHLSNPTEQNGRNERFNRTLRHGFVQANEHFADDLHAFNRQLAAWLIWHNAQKPHRALAGNTPLNFPRNRLKNGQLLWTPTQICISREKIIQSANHLSRTQMPTNNMNMRPGRLKRISEPTLERIRAFTAAVATFAVQFSASDAQAQIPLRLSRFLPMRPNNNGNKTAELDGGFGKIISRDKYNFA